MVAMKQVGAYEAKTHLPRLLAAVEKGETVVITRRGIPVARLTPIEEGHRDEVREVIARMRRARARRARVSVAEILSARDEGRK